MRATRLDCVLFVFTALFVTSAAPAGCGGHAAEVAPSEGATRCEDRERARPICLRAVDAQCTSMRSDCEAKCQPRLPGSSEKEPALRGDIEEDRCREGCGEQDRACRAAMAARCPRPCLQPLACEPADPACADDAGP